MPWPPAPADFLARAVRLSDRGLAQHYGVSKDTVYRFRRKLAGRGPAPAAPPAPPAATAGALSIDASPDAQTLEGPLGTRVTTVDQLLAVARVDRAAWEVERQVVNKWEVGMKHPTTGEALVAPLYQVKAWLRRKRGPSPAEQVEALVAGALASRTPRPRAPVAPRPGGALLQVVCVADPHFAKYAWGQGTGHGDYDLAIARREVLAGGRYLLGVGAQRGVAERVLAFLGDVFHYDTPAGTTTGGTALDRDSRAEKMLEVGAQTVCDLIADSAETAPTRVVLVPGNHDTMLTVALRRILQAEFRAHRRVVVAPEVTKRQYHLWGRNLLGFDHGDKRKKELAAAMAIERPREWGASVYREIHTGHLHSEGERYEGTLTHAGVIVRTHRALCPPDAWHADEGFVGAPRGMSAWTYHRDGGLVGCDVAAPRLLAPTRSRAA